MPINSHNNITELRRKLDPLTDEYAYNVADEATTVDRVANMVRPALPYALGAVGVGLIVVGNASPSAAVGRSSLPLHNVEQVAEGSKPDLPDSDKLVVRNHTVRKGESLWKIAGNHKTAVPELLRRSANKKYNKHPGLIQPGDVVEVGTSDARDRAAGSRTGASASRSTVSVSTAQKSSRKLKPASKPHATVQQAERRQSKPATTAVAADRDIDNQESAVTEATAETNATLSSSTERTDSVQQPSTLAEQPSTADENKNTLDSRETNKQSRSTSTEPLITSDKERTAPIPEQSEKAQEVLREQTPPVVEAPKALPVPDITFDFPSVPPAPSVEAKPQDVVPPSVPPSEAQVLPTPAKPVEAPADVRKPSEKVKLAAVPSLHGVSKEIIQDELKYLMDEVKLTPLGAAYLTGNLLQESSLNPSVNPGDSGTAFGLAQWRFDRRIGMPGDRHAQSKWAVDVEMPRSGSAELQRLLRDPDATESQLRKALKQWERYGFEGARYDYGHTLAAAIGAIGDTSHATPTPNTATTPNSQSQAAVSNTPAPVGESEAQVKLPVPEITFNITGINDLNANTGSQPIVVLPGVLPPPTIEISVPGLFTVDVAGNIIPDSNTESQPAIQQNSTVAANEVINAPETKPANNSSVFIFPLQTTQQDMLRQPMKWCNKSTTSCHHDYNAADLFADVGTPVVSPVKGKVTSANEDTSNNPSRPTVGSRVQVRGADGRLYYFAHMKDGLAVRPGQQINPGDKIGEVGEKYDAMGTPEHVHFDMSPRTTSSRPACSGPSCSNKPFINPQPELIQAYNNLPASGTEPNPPQTTENAPYVGVEPVVTSQPVPDNRPAEPAPVSIIPPLPVIDFGGLLPGIINELVLPLVTMPPTPQPAVTTPPITLPEAVRPTNTSVDGGSASGTP